MNYYEHHLGDYDGATAHLSWLEDCAYRRLICLYYRHESPIPPDIKQACRLARATSKPERDAVQQVLSEFFDLRPDGWHHRRCDAEIERYREKSNKARASVSKRWAGRSANEERTNNGGSANEQRTNNERNTNVLPTQYEGNTPRARPQTPDTRHQTDGRESVGTEPLLAESPPPENRALTGLRPAGTRIPDDWQPDEVTVERIRQARPDLVPVLAEVAERFRLWAQAKPGPSGFSLDWQLSFRRWALNERRHKPERPANAQAALEERNRLVAEAWEPPEVRDAAG